MGFRKDISKSQIFMESDDLFNNMWFGYKRDKFYHNIDTLYYTVSLKGDFNKNPSLTPFLDELYKKKNEYLTTKLPVKFNDKLLIERGRFDDIYEYRLSCPEKYDIYVTSYLPNSSTPRIAVQLRSAGLWIDGVKETMEDSFYQIYKILGSYGLEVSNVYENRLDYCYHTNYVQDMYSFFNDMKINKQIKTNMKSWRKDGLIFDDGLELNYFALGNRSSNNVFTRIYDKTREVVELAYKGFFIYVWFENGLISAYDKYVLEYAYKYKSYEKRYEGMLKFYLEFGTDELHKKEINHYLKDTDINFNDIKKLARALLPEVTTITNIEFQTKRKFYYYGDEQINNFNTSCRVDKLSRLYKIIDNRKIFLDYLTHYTLRFVDDSGNYKSWWKRLRGLKINSFDIIYKYARNYQMNLDKEKIIRDSIRKIATLSIYDKNKVGTSFAEDLTDFISILNDNDVYNGKFEIYHEENAEFISNIESRYLCDYDKYKEDKYTLLKSKLDEKENEAIKKFIEQT